MKKFFLYTSILIFIGIALSASFYFKLNSINPLENLILETYSSLSLGVVIILFGVIFEDLWQKEKNKKRLKNEFNLFSENLKNVFSRVETPWNFNNRTSSFYFDSSHINKIHDLLFDNNQRWYQFILEYKELFPKDFKKTKVLNLLYKFNSKLNQGQIVAERIDHTIMKLFLNPSLAAQKDSAHNSEILTLNLYYDQKYLFYRACYIEINTTRALFDSIKYIDTSINMQRIEGIYNEAVLSMNSSTEECKVLKENIIKLRKSRKELLDLSKKIQKIINTPPSTSFPKS